MVFRVEASAQARHDALAIFEWLLDNKVGEQGLRWFRNLQVAIDSLKQMPQRCPLAPENASVPFEIRQLLYGSKRHRYRILVTIENETVLILRIRNPGQRSLVSPLQRK